MFPLSEPSSSDESSSEHDVTPDVIKANLALQTNLKFPTDGILEDSVVHHALKFAIVQYQIFLDGIENITAELDDPIYYMDKFLGTISEIKTFLDSGNIVNLNFYRLYFLSQQLCGFFALVEFHHNNNGIKLDQIRENLESLLFTFYSIPKLLNNKKIGSECTDPEGIINSLIETIKNEREAATYIAYKKEAGDKMAKEYNPGPLTILCLDDDQEVHNLRSYQLEETKAIYIASTDPAQCIDIIRENPNIDALILDFNLGVDSLSSGIEVAINVKRIRPAMANLLSTGDHFKQETIQLLSDANLINGYVQKPGNPFAIFQ